MWRLQKSSNSKQCKKFSKAKNKKKKTKIQMLEVNFQVEIFRFAQDDEDF